MEAINKEAEIHHGRNIRLARGWRAVTQEWLADKLRISQKQISTFESQQTVEDMWLDKIANSLDIPVDFLKTFHLNEAGKNFYNSMNETTQNNTSGEHSNETVTQQIVGEQENTINHTYPIDEIKDLYNKLLEEKDKQIARFEKQVGHLEKQMEELKQNMK